MPKEKEDEFEEFEFIKIEGRDIFFYCDVDDETVQELAVGLSRLDKNLRKACIDLGLDEFPEIRIFIKSCGGDFHAGLGAMDRIKSCKCRTLTVVEGDACSAAALMLLGGDRRMMTKHSFILFHQLSTYMNGSVTYTEAKADLKNDDMFMETAKNVLLENTNFSEKMIKKMHKRDIFLNSDKALKYGVIHDIFS